MFWPGLGDPCVCQRHRGVCVCDSPGQLLFCAYTICSYGQISISCTSPSGSPCPASCVLSFGANLLHSLITWLMVSSLSPHSLHLLFCCVLSVLALIWLVLMALFCADIRRDSCSLLNFPFLSHIQVFSCDMSFFSRLQHP